MLGQVKVFDGKGNLKKIIQPVASYEVNPMCKAREHQCPRPGCGKLTKLKVYCSKDCSTEMKRIKAQINKKKYADNRIAAKALKAGTACRVCGTIIASNRSVYCKQECRNEAGRRNSKVNGWDGHKKYGPPMKVYIHDKA